MQKECLYLFINFFILLIVIWIQRKYNVGEVVRNILKHHKHKNCIPLLGGLIFIIPLLVYGENMIHKVFVGSHYLLGLVDDVIKLFRQDGESVKGKSLYGFTAIMGIFLVLNLNVKFSHIFLKLFYMFILIPGIVHSCNLLDGFNGGLTINSILVLLLSTCVFKFFTLSMFSKYFILTLFAFLCVNLPGLVFMSSVGSYTIGAALAYIFVTSASFELTLFALVIPIISSITVIINRSHYLLFKSTVFLFSPVHHSFFLCGYSENFVNVLYTSLTIVSFLCYNCINKYIL